MFAITPTTINKAAIASLLATALVLVNTGILATHEAQAQQSGITCPLTPQANRIIASFDTTNPLVAHLTLNEATTNSVAAALTAGVYNITAVAYDDHSTKNPPQNQTTEQFYLRLNNGQTTNRTSDIPESDDYFTEQIDTNFTITSDVTDLFAQHAEYPDPNEPSSLFAVCVAFDNVTPTPSPTPTPTPSPSPTPALSGDGGPGDEQDCCPGPDPTPEPTPEPTETPQPRVAGTQTESPTPPPAGGTTPRVAGLSTFPIAGPPAWLAAFVVASLLTALLVTPAVEQTSRH